MKILFVAPLPPPVTGHSLISRALLDHLAPDQEMEIVDLSKSSSKEGVDSVRRIVEVLGVLRDVLRKKGDADAVYLTISESLAGNVKDLCIYLACFALLPRTYIHLHGGTIKRELWDRHSSLHALNRFFIRRLGGVIISGDAHRSIFEGLIDATRVHIVPNFAGEDLFVDEDRITAKFSRTEPLRVLYISSMRRRKGYLVLVDAFEQLSDDLKGRLQIDLAGRFDSPVEEARFRERIAGMQQVQYHGVVDEDTKRSLFVSSHVFCLPTAYFEGQPISILEAYASGCVVLTTGQLGIRDIFRDGTNGLEVEASSVRSMRSGLEALVSRHDELLHIALTNRRIAWTTYRSSAYLAAVRSILTHASGEARADVSAPDETATALR